MSWATVKGALVAKVTVAAGTTKVHPYWPLCSDNPSHPNFATLFVHAGVFHTWFIHRSGYLREKSPEDDQVYLVTHEVEITAMRALKEGAVAEAAFRTALESVTAAFHQDRTLGGKVNTLSIPDFQQITEVTFQRTSVACYKAESTILIEEIVRP